MESEKKKESPIPELGVELERFEGDTFFLAEYEDGILYHVYNSMDLVVRRGVSSAFDLLRYVIHTANHEYKTMDEEDRKGFDMMVQGLSYLLGMPRVVFIDNQFMLEATECIMNNLTRIAQDALDKPLQEETTELDEGFKQAVEGIETLKGMVE